MRVNVLLIRKATLRDVEKIVQIHVTTWKISYRGYIKDSILDSSHFDVSEKRIEKMKIPVEKGLVFVVEDAGEIKGFLGLDDFKIPLAEIKVFYISPQSQHKGYGKKLLDTVKADLKSQGVQKINLFTLKNYPVSNQFYQKQGFCQTGREEFLAWANVWCHEYQMAL